MRYISRTSVTTPMGGSAVEDTCRRHSHSASIHPIVTPRFAADPTGKAPKHASQLRSFHGCHSIPQLSQSLIFRIGGNTSTTFRNAIGAFLLSEYAFRNNPNRGVSPPLQEGGVLYRAFLLFKKKYHRNCDWGGAREI